MSIDNLVNIDFSAEERLAIEQHLQGLEEIFKSKVVQITSDDSKRYGKLGEGNEGWAKILFNDTFNYPTLLPSFVDGEAWKKHDEIRDLLNPITARLVNLTQQVVDTNRLVGYDIYRTCMTVYQNARFLCKKNVPGFKAYFEKWKIHFTNKKSTKSVQTAKKMNN